MNKRFKILSLSMSFVLCFSLFLVGVFAASSVSLNVSSSIMFKSNGAYVMATGQVYRGADTNIGTGSELEETDRPSEDVSQNASYSYLGHSYTPVGSGEDMNLPDGSPSTDLDTWNIGMVEFLSNESVIKYEIVFKNYGENSLRINVDGIPENIDNVDITYTSLPLIVSAGETKTFTLTACLTNFYESFENVDLNLIFTIEKNEIKYYTCNWSTSSRYANIGFQILVDDEVKLVIDGTLNANGSFQILEGSVITYISGVDTQTLSIEPRSPTAVFSLSIYDASTYEQLAYYTYVGWGDTTTVEGFPLTVTSDINIIVEESYD